MGLPDYFEELREPAHRPKLWLGVWSGYFMAAAFAVLAMVAQALSIVDDTGPFYIIIAAKLVTNTIALWGLRTDTLVLETQGINTVGDVLLMTGGVYFTGGEVSPLFPIYVIELSVVALLSNLAVTITTSAIIWLSYCAMAVLTHIGTLPQQSAPAITGVDIDASYVATELVFAAFVIGVPTVYISLILRSLSDKTKQLEQRNAELIDAGKEKAQFMANVTHELRTPIHGICGLTELMESGVYGPLTAKQAKAMESIRRSALGQLSMVDQLLQLSKAEVGKLQAKPTRIDPREVVEAVASAVRWMVGTKQLTVTVDLSDDVCEVETDRGMLNQILVNLAANAAKFTPARGTVALSAMASADGVLLTVSDDGPGIPATEQARVFDAFRQVDGTDERAYGGVGLGLSLVQRLADELGAKVKLDSQVGRGTTFTVAVPRTWAGADKGRAPLPAAPDGETGSEARERDRPGQT